MAAALLLTYCLSSPLQAIDVLWHRIIPYKGLGTPALAFILGLTVWWPLNWFFDAKTWTNNAAIAKGDPLEMLMRKALETTKAVLMTVKNGKVYVGFVTHNSGPAEPIESVRLFPLASGYRESDTRRVVFTTAYAPILKKVMDGAPEVSHITAEDFEIVIPHREIESVSFFDPVIYNLFNSEQPPIAPGDTSAKTLPPKE